MATATATIPTHAITITCYNSSGTLVTTAVPTKGLTNRARALLKHHPDFSHQVLLRSHRTNAELLRAQLQNTAAS